MNRSAEILNQFVCGDCFEKLAELPPASVDLVLTDPPYGIDYQSNRRVKREKLPKFENDIDLNWVEGWVEQVHRVLKDDRHFYCFTRFDTYPVFFSAIQAKFKVKNCLIWVKNNHGSGDLDGSYAPQSEMIIFAVKGRRLLNGTRESDVLSHDNIPSAHRHHATQKPVDLLRVLIEKSTEPGELVLDPFAGVGSTGLACLDTHRSHGDHFARNYHLIELNSDFVRKGIEGGLGTQETLLTVPQKTRLAVPPKLRPAVRTTRYKARKDETLYLQL
jgi:site-specific DNA-methyltransferase (adenine-specific)